MFKVILLASAFLLAPGFTNSQDFDIKNPPRGYIQFCLDNKTSCSRYTKIEPPIVLDLDSHAKILDINSDINAAIEPISDNDMYGLDEFWTYPILNKGDCEDIMLEKQRVLIENGFPKNRLLPAAVFIKSKNEFHAVLFVDTTDGIFILDSLTDDIWALDETDYVYIKHVSPNNILEWIPLISQEEYDEILTSFFMEKNQ